MQIVSDNELTVRLRRMRSARVVEHPAGVTAYPEPHATPLLPQGWGPLEAPDQAAVLEACDEFADACRLRLGSVWDTSSEYRVYCLEGPIWGGLHVATVYRSHRNARLLAVAARPDDAARIALDFVNWDLEAAGAGWRLGISQRPAR
jgi:hypothetical protein